MVGVGKWPNDTCCVVQKNLLELVVSKCNLNITNIIDIIPTFKISWIFLICFHSLSSNFHFKIFQSVLTILANSYKIEHKMNNKTIWEESTKFMNLTSSVAHSNIRNVEFHHVLTSITSFSFTPAASHCHPNFWQCWGELQI